MNSSIKKKICEKQCRIFYKNPIHLSPSVLFVVVYVTREEIDRRGKVDEEKNILSRCVVFCSTGVCF